MSPSLDKPWFHFETYQGVPIMQRGRTYRVCDLRFKSIRDARAYIDGVRSHGTGDQIERIAAHLVEEVTRTIGKMFDTSGLANAGLHAGGVVQSPLPKELPEGVIGYTLGGRPVYDGAYLDRVLKRPGSVTFRVRDGQVVRDDADER
jgi:hypothetical protein